MSVRVSRRLLEAALAGLNEADAPTLDTAADYNALVSALDSSADQTRWSTQSIEGMGDGFIKRNGAWYVTTELTSDQLTQILSPSGEEKLAKADRRKSTDLSLEASDFVIGIGKGVNFVREERGGAWRDNTPINSKMLAAYKFKEQMGAVMPVTKEGALRAVKDDKFMFVISENTGEFYIMDAANDPSDPLGSMKRLFDNATLNRYFGVDSQEINDARKLTAYIDNHSTDATPKEGEKPTPANKKYAEVKKDRAEIAENFTDIASFVDKPKGFNFNTNFFKGGKIEDAMKSARTIFSAFFDLFFKGADLKMEFVFTEYGPAFKRQQQFLRNLFGSETALSDADFRKFEGTDYFEVVDLPKANGKYKFAGGTDAVDISSDTNPAVAKKTVASLGGTATGSDSYGWAYVLYLLGILTKESEQPASGSAEPALPTTPTPPAEDPGAKVREYVENSIVGKPLGDGALFFDFNVTEPRTNVNPIPEAYYSNVAQAVKAHVDKIKEILGNSGVMPTNTAGAKRWFDVTLIGTADPIGTTNYNNPLSEKRIGPALKAKIEQVAGSGVNMYVVSTKELGENPWSEYKKISDKNTTPGVHENLRFVKAFGDSTTEIPNETYFKWAQDFAKSKNVNLDSLKESRDITRLRDQIRQILSERVTRHE